MARAAYVALAVRGGKMFKLVAGGFASGIIVTKGVYFPPEIWPLFGFIVVVYVLMAAWELRVLLPEPAQRDEQPAASPEPVAQRRLPAQTRSSTA